jgi:alginate O-acetyltransferase complex protein AlgI
MLLGGLWHGANWTFVVWGGIHGLGLAVERKLQKMLGIQEHKNAASADTRSSLFSLKSWVGRIFIFHLVCLAWVFFRASSLGAACTMLAGVPVWNWRPEYLTAFAFLAFYTIPLFVIDLVNEYRGEEYLFENYHESLRLAYAFAGFVALAIYSGNNLNAFIYFQF